MQRANAACHESTSAQTAMPERYGGGEERTKHGARTRAATKAKPAWKRSINAASSPPLVGAVVERDGGGEGGGGGNPHAESSRFSRSSTGRSGSHSVVQPISFA